MAVDGRSDGSKDAISDALVLGQGDDGFQVLVSHGADRQLVILLSQIVGQDHRREHGKAWEERRGGVELVLDNQQRKSFKK